MNVILLSVDCLRSDHISYNGYGRNTTPFIDTLADEGLNFEQAYSASSHTPEAIPALITGMHPHQFSNNDYRMLGRDIASYLKHEVYSSGGFHSNVNISQIFGYGDDFDIYNDDMYQSSSKFLARAVRKIKKVLWNRPMYYARADKINQRAISWLDSSATEPYFCWLHYMDTHGPYDPPKSMKGKYASENISSKESKELFKKAMNQPEQLEQSERRILLDLYDEEIRYVDKKINNLVNKIKDISDWENTLLILTADHGDGFGEHGYYNHPRFVHKELTHVPLIITGTEVQDSIQCPVSTLDIVPTVLENTQQQTNGFEVEFPGVPLLQVANNPAKYEDRFIISAARGENENSHLRRYCIRTSDMEEFVTYNLEIDDFEDSSSGSEMINSLSEQIRNTILELESEFGVAHDSSESEIANEEVQDRLEALGYK